MNKLKRTVMILMLSLMGFVASSHAQEANRSLSARDLQTIREVNAERDYYRQKYEEEQRAHDVTKTDRDAWQKSSVEWKETAEKEKYRADVTQGNRIRKLEDANTGMFQANFQLREQTKADRQELGRVNAENIRLKSLRKWYFAAGAVTGLATGGFAGYQAGKKYGVTVRF